MQHDQSSSSASNVACADPWKVRHRMRAKTTLLVEVPACRKHDEADAICTDDIQLLPSTIPQKKRTMSPKQRDRKAEWETTKRNREMKHQQLLLDHAEQGFLSACRLHREHPHVFNLMAKHNVWNRGAGPAQDAETLREDAIAMGLDRESVDRAIANDKSHKWQRDHSLADCAPKFGMSVPTNEKFDI